MREIVTAEEQYQEYPELKREAVQELAEWIRQYPEYPTPSEEQVIRFLFSCYFDINRAKKCVQQYYSIRLEYTEIFSYRDILNEELRTQADVVQYGVIPNKDPNGYVVALHRLQVFDPPQYIFDHSCRLLCMLTDALLYKEGNMKGFIIVFDMRGVALMHIFRLKLAALNVFFTYVQEGSPLRLKAVHVVNTLPIAAKIMFLIRPFLKKELLDLLHFHSDDYEEVQKFLPRDCLPCDFGGTQPSIAQLHEDYKKWMLDMREVFMEADEETREFIEKRKAETEPKPTKSWFFF